MNKRIRELMLEAGYAAPEIAARGQRLAELLVRECVAIVKQSEGIHYFGEKGKEVTMFTVAKQIEGHLGVR